MVGGHVWWGGMHGGGGGHVWQGGHAWQGGHVWQGVCIAGGHMWQGGMHGRGACVVGGMHGRGAMHAMHAPRHYEIQSVNAWAVRILLECILVFSVITLARYLPSSILKKIVQGDYKVRHVLILINRHQMKNTAMCFQIYDYFTLPETDSGTDSDSDSCPVQK